MDRRAWLGAVGGLVAGGLASACATAATVGRGRPGRRSFEAVRVSPDAVIREVVGLRPYRPGGFVVSADRFQGKALVHNYGHGGGGVTLSWGTAEMAANLVTGTGATEGDVAVLGAGVVGLSTAILLQRRGRAVTIYARDLPPNTTSNVAGAQWSPTTVADRLDGPFGIQFERAARLAYRQFQNLVGPDHGVRWIDNYFLSEERLPVPTYMSRIRDLYPEWEELEGEAHPFPTRWARRVTTMFIEPHRYLPALVREFLAFGGRFVVGEIHDLPHVARLPEATVVNCTGLGSRRLFADDSMVPIKGQLVFLRPQPGVDYLTIGGGRFSTGGGLYMFPRSDGVLLGGTFERGVETLVPDPAETRRIVSAHARLFAATATGPQG